jgi:TPR repeat protein
MRKHKDQIGFMRIFTILVVAFLCGCASGGLKYQVETVDILDEKNRTLISSGCASICSDIMGGAWCDYFAGQSIAQCNEQEANNEFRKRLEIIDRYHKMAIKGDNEAQQKVGLMYYLGYGVKKDYTEALKWFELGAENNNSESQYSLGAMYYQGYGVQPNKDEGVKWFRRSASNGNVDARNTLQQLGYH